MVKELKVTCSGCGEESILRSTTVRPMNVTNATITLVLVTMNAVANVA
jgi:pyruvate/2-oxoacid:ferredoxin oxidoreductase beta subunit